MSVLDLCQRNTTVSTTLLVAFMFPRIFYASTFSRTATFVIILIETVFVYRPHNFTNVVVMYLNGFASMMFVIWSANLLLFRNPIRHFRRLRLISTESNDPKSAHRHEWEPFPRDFGLKRAAWVIDLLINFRGIGWNYRTPAYPLPKDIEKLYLDDDGIKVSPGRSIKQTRSNTLDRSSFIKHTSLRLILGYLLIDFCITLMDLNPFFQASEPPLYWAYPITARKLLIFPYNCALSGIGVFAVLDFYHACIAFVEVLVIGPVHHGTWGEPFMYPRLSGSILALWHDGLPGFWSIFWHDVFKHPFQAFAYGLIPEPPTLTSTPTPTPITTASSSSSVPTSNTNIPHQIRSFARLNLIFLLSALCHAAGSYQTSRPTSPLITFLVFSIQGLGITLHNIISYFLKTHLGVSETWRKVVLFGFGVCWMYGTMYLFLADLAAMGGFVLKLVPVSVIGLAMGRGGLGWKEGVEMLS